MNGVNDLVTQITARLIGLRRKLNTTATNQTENLQNATEDGQLFRAETTVMLVWREKFRCQ